MLAGIFYLRVFGYPCYVHLDFARRSKLRDTAITGFLGRIWPILRDMSRQENHHWPYSQRQSDSFNEHWHDGHHMPLSTPTDQHST
eukprot:scaffold302052_cov17-Prasinocladus_malaysianus.AAC.1